MYCHKFNFNTIFHSSFDFKFKQYAMKLFLDLDKDLINF